MKCQKCGKNEINFHYSSNVNGCVTETHMCSACAAESGFDLGKMFDTRSFFSGFFPPVLSGGFLPALGIGIANPFGQRAKAGLPTKECSCDGACEAPAEQNPATQIDDEMQKRREINVIREQMLLAAEKEDYEKAAELRDQIKQMENGNAL